ncbi:LemA family protein, partial [Propioniciclava flava]
EQLSSAVRGLMVSVEAYPELKSNQNFLELQRALAETEDRIAAGRRYYNANVRNYNTRTESVPQNLIANAFHFEKATYFEVNDPDVRRAPDVSFGGIAYRGDEPQQPGQSPPAAAPQLPNPQQAPQIPQQQGYQAPSFGQVPQVPQEQTYQPPTYGKPAQAPQQQPAGTPAAAASGASAAGLPATVLRPAAPGTPAVTLPRRRALTPVGARRRVRGRSA